ncbi:MAG: shikimate dehydrogenase family protein [Candidatus Zixiibacteriota bacterium]
MPEKRNYKFGLLGEQVDYSRSPEIFRVIFELEQIDGDWRTINCSPEKLEGQVRRLRESAFDAVSVTIPHKEAIIPFLDDIDDVAGALGSANSMLFRNGRISGFNTDAYGFAQPLMSEAPRLKGELALVFGSGGAARSVTYALALDFELAEVILIGRSPRRLENTQTRLSSALPRVRVRTMPWPDGAEIDASVALAGGNTIAPSLIVNATPLGGPNQPLAQSHGAFDDLPTSTIYYDLNYNDDSSLINSARDRGLRALDGLPMLIHQALRSYYLWTGRHVSFEEVWRRMKAHAA